MSVEKTDFYKLITSTGEVESLTLDQAMTLASDVNEFVTIKGADFEIVGKFGVDSIKNGRCPDGEIYDWNKSSRIGRVQKERK